jgi:hypothetical protein
MKNSRLFLGLTTLCLAVAGIVAGKTKSPSTRPVYTKAVADAPCTTKFVIRTIQPYTTNGTKASPTVFTAFGCAHAWKYFAIAGE